MMGKAGDLLHIILSSRCRKVDDLHGMQTGLIKRSGKLRQGAGPALEMNCSV
jgi:hypothetical protein